MKRAKKASSVEPRQHLLLPILLVRFLVPLLLRLPLFPLLCLSLHSARLLPTLLPLPLRLPFLLPMLLPPPLLSWP